MLAGYGDLPELLVRAAMDGGREPQVFAIEGEADPQRFVDVPMSVVRWGEIGRLFRLIQTTDCREAVFIGGIRRRPSLVALRPDLGAIRLLPRLVPLLRAGDDTLLRGVAAIFQERGVELVSPLDVASSLGVPPGILTGRLTPTAMQDIGIAAEAARGLGRRDLGQAAVAVAGRVVAVEDARGTASLLARVAALRRAGSLPGHGPVGGAGVPAAGGVLVKCMKPQQDRRLDLPTVGPATAVQAYAAGLHGVAVEAGRSLLAGRAETIEAFRSRGLFLYGMEPRDVEADG